MKITDVYKRQQFNKLLKMLDIMQKILLKAKKLRKRIMVLMLKMDNGSINSILESLHELVDANEDADFVKQIHLIETIKGAGFLSAVSIMGEIGEFVQLRERGADPFLPCLQEVEL